MRTLWVKAIIFLAAIWLIAGGVIWWARSTKPTPERLAAYIERHPLDGQSPANRLRAIDSVADQLNALSYEQRRQIRGGRKLDHFFRTLTSEEQARFLDRTLPTGFKQMMEAFNKMTPEKRRQFVEKTLAEMKKQEGEERPPDVDDQNVEKIISEGLKSFYTEASAEVKMDFAPLIEQMQKNLQWR
jgi:hypothetical protein